MFIFCLSSCFPSVLTHTDTGTNTNTLTRRPSLSYFTNTLCIKMKEVNRNVFCKQNGSPFASLIRRSSPQHHIQNTRKSFPFIWVTVGNMCVFFRLVWGGSGVNTIIQSVLFNRHFLRPKMTFCQEYIHYRVLIKHFYPCKCVTVFVVTPSLVVTLDVKVKWKWDHQLTCFSAVRAVWKDVFSPLSMFSSPNNAPPVLPWFSIPLSRSCTFFTSQYKLTKWCSADVRRCGPVVSVHVLAF